MAKQLVLCRSDAGDGGWSLHAPGSTDEAIANGEAPALASGDASYAPGTRVETDDDAGIVTDPDFADAPAPVPGMLWVAWSGGTRTWAPSDAITGATNVEWTRPSAFDYRLAWSELGPNTSSHIGIEIVDGARFVDEADKERAREAAAAVLNRAEVAATAAEAEYRRQWDEFDDEERMTGLALVWIDARSAADLALTEGWAEPNGASCSIYT